MRRLQVYKYSSDDYHCVRSPKMLLTKFITRFDSSLFVTSRIEIRRRNGSKQQQQQKIEWNDYWKEEEEEEEEEEMGF